MSGVQRISDLYAEVHDLVDLEGPGEQAIVQRLSLQPLHHDEWLAIVFTDVVDGADVGVIQGRCRARFDAKALDRLSIACQLFRDELESYSSAEALIVGAIHHAHSAGTELRSDPIVRNSSTDHTDVLRW
jgi:hypothetical protein